LDHAVGNAFGGMHCFLSAVSVADFSEVATVSAAPDENSNLSYVPNYDWRMGGFRQPLRIPNGMSSCQFLRCAHNAGKDIDADEYDYTSLGTNSNWFISEITNRCGGSAAFPNGAYGGDDVGLWQ
jgi:hypothetical protein